jgi:hypothetical protein
MAPTESVSDHHIAVSPRFNKGKFPSPVVYDNSSYASCLLGDCDLEFVKDPICRSINR